MNLHTVKITSHTIKCILLIISWYILVQIMNASIDQQLKQQSHGCDAPIGLVLNLAIAGCKNINIFILDVYILINLVMLPIIVFWKQSKIGILLILMDILFGLWNIGPEIKSPDGEKLIILYLFTILSSAIFIFSEIKYNQNLQKEDTDNVPVV